MLHAPWEVVDEVDGFDTIRTPLTIALPSKVLMHSANAGPVKGSLKHSSEESTHLKCVCVYPLES